MQYSSHRSFRAVAALQYSLGLPPLSTEQRLCHSRSSVLDDETVTNQFLTPQDCSLSLLAPLKGLHLKYSMLLGMSDLAKPQARQSWLETEPGMCEFVG